jgi:hypothetical protein
VTPLLVEWTFKDGSKELEKIPAEIWRYSESEVNHIFAKDKEVASMVFDPNKELADVNVENNVFPRKKSQSAFDKAKEKRDN